MFKSNILPLILSVCSILSQQFYFHQMFTQSNPGQKIVYICVYIFSQGKLHESLIYRFVYKANS